MPGFDPQRRVPDGIIPTWGNSGAGTTVMRSRTHRERLRGNAFTRWPGRVLHVAKLALIEFFRDDMTTYAAALAYRVLFSLFPFLVFLTTLLGVLGAPQLFEWMREQAAYVLPAEGMQLVNTVLAELQRSQGGLMSMA